MTRSILALGSNIGDRLEHMRTAVLRIGELGSVVAVSSLYETDPVGGPVQGRFLNAAVLIDTELSARRLLDAVLAIEREAGRVRDIQWGPRTLDIDLICHGDEVIEEPALVVPHPRAIERRFVLEPVAEIAPDVMVSSGLSAAAALAAVPPGGVFRWAGHWVVDQPRLGTLGHVLVGLQFVLFLVFASIAVFTGDLEPVAWRLTLGVAVAALGGFLAVGALLALGKDLSALPDPRPGANLVQRGVFGMVRHPIYGGLLLGGVGASITLSSSWALVPLIALAVLFRYKSGMEERALTLAHPEYSSYRVRVPRRFIPVIW